MLFHVPLRGWMFIAKVEEYFSCSKLLRNPDLAFWDCFNVTHWPIGGER